MERHVLMIFKGSFLVGHEGCHRMLPGFGLTRRHYAPAGGAGQGDAGETGRPWLFGTAAAELVFCRSLSAYCW